MPSFHFYPYALSLFVLFWCGKPVLTAQPSVSHLDSVTRELIKLTEETYGSDPILVNGKKYIIPHYQAQGHPFLLSDGFTKGNVFINGKLFAQIHMAYDIYSDEVVFNTPVNEDNYIYITPGKLAVDSFSLYNLLFVNALHYKNIALENGYLELVYQGKVLVFRKHFKSFIPDLSKKGISGRYSKAGRHTYIFNNDRLYPVITRKMLLDCFPGKEREIRSFLRQHNIKYSQAGTDQLKILFQFCEGFIHHD